MLVCQDAFAFFFLEVPIVPPLAAFPLGEVEPIQANFAALFVVGKQKTVRRVAVGSGEVQRLFAASASTVRAVPIKLVFPKRVEWTALSLGSSHSREVV